MTPGATTGAAAAVSAGILTSGSGSGFFFASTGSSFTGTVTGFSPLSSTFFGGSGLLLPPPPPPPPGPGCASHTMSGSRSGRTA